MVLPKSAKVPPSINGDKFYVHIAKGDVQGLYKAPEGGGWGTVSVNDYLIDYAPYWDKPEMEKYDTIFGFEMSTRNEDSPSCSGSTMTVHGHALPGGWRLDEGGCQNFVNGQSSTDVCALLAIEKGTAHGAYELLFTYVKEEDGQRSPLYPLWICVGGFNPWFQSIFNNRHPPWECTYKDKEGKTQSVSKPDRAKIKNPCKVGTFLYSGDFIPTECEGTQTAEPTRSPTNEPTENATEQEGTKTPTWNPTEQEGTQSPTENPTQDVSASVRPVHFLVFLFLSTTTLCCYPVSLF